MPDLESVSGSESGGAGGCHKVLPIRTPSHLEHFSCTYLGFVGFQSSLGIVTYYRFQNLMDTGQLSSRDLEKIHGAIT